MVGNRLARHASFGVAAALVSTVAFTASPVAPAAAVGPAVIEVTHSQDISDPGDGLISLREAVELANTDGVASEVRIPSGHSIGLSGCAGPTNGTLYEYAGEPFVLDGGGSTIEQTCNSPVLSSYTGPVTIRNVTLRGGRNSTGCCAGGFYADTADAVLVEGVRLIDNETVDGSGGGGMLSAGSGPVTVRDTEISGNDAANTGGGLRTLGPAVIERSSIWGNTSGGGGGGIASAASLVVVDSTLAGNVATNHGGAISANGSVELRHVTIAGNQSTGAQVFAGQITTGGSVFADPIGAAESCFSGSPLVSLGQNYATTDCGLGDQDTKGAPSPQLRPIWNNGSGRPSMYPRQGSPLLDVVSAGDPQLSAVDQRGSTRPAGAGGDIGAIEVKPCGGRYNDVAAGSLFCWEIGWLGDAEVTGGRPDGSFGVSAPVTRGSMAAFLYRLAGAPEFTLPLTGPTFTDVPESHPFYRPIEWLASTAVTTGRGDGTFGHDAAVSRQSMAAFLFRLAGSQGAGSEPSVFTDVPADHPFREPIVWLTTKGITGGYADSTFRPGAVVSRGAMASFLYRFADGQRVNPTP
jgi:predicted outer membrane repeat protein